MLLTAFIEGLYDGITPFMLVVWLMFFYLLLTRGQTTKRVFWLGMIFLFSIFSAEMLSIYGFYDPFFSNEKGVLVVQVFYFLVGLLFMILGCVNLRRWWEFRSLRNWSDEDDSQVSVWRWHQKLWYSASAFSVGYFLVVLSSIWRGEFEYILLAHVKSINNKLQGVFSTGGAYVFGFYLLGLLIWGMFFIGTRLKKTHFRVSMIQGLSSASFLACGLGLVLILLKEWFF